MGTRRREVSQKRWRDVVPLGWGKGALRLAVEMSRLTSCPITPDSSSRVSRTFGRRRRHPLPVCPVSPVYRTRTVTTVGNKHRGLPMVRARPRGLDYRVTFCARQPAPGSGSSRHLVSYYLSILRLASQPALGLVLKLLQMCCSSPSQAVHRRCYCSCRGKFFLHVGAA